MPKLIFPHYIILVLEIIPKTLKAGVEFIIMFFMAGHQIPRGWQICLLTISAQIPNLGITSFGDLIISVRKTVKSGLMAMKF